jgi:hypothetical protein
MWLSHQKKMVRKEVKRMMIKGLDHNDLITFTFTEVQVQNELKWKHSKEFEYKGNMYDIVTSKKEDGRYTYTCWLDKKETKLNRELAKLFGEKWNKEKTDYQNGTYLAHFVDSLFFNALAKPNVQSTNRNKLLTIYVVVPVDCFYSPIHQPPELCYY